MMLQKRFVVLFVIVSATATTALLLGKQAARTGDGILGAAGAVTGVAALIGIALLGRVVIVVERSRRRQ